MKVEAHGDPEVPISGQVKVKLEQPETSPEGTYNVATSLARRGKCKFDSARNKALGHSRNVMPKPEAADADTPPSSPSPVIAPGQINTSYKDFEKRFNSATEAELDEWHMSHFGS